SAGASLIAEEIPYLQSKGLPKPGVLGLYCGGAYDFIGDSTGISALINGNSPSSGGAGYAGMDYFKGTDVQKPEVIPAASDELIKQFPPTIFVTATRDMAMSNAAYSYRRMIKAGIDAQLLIYDGLGHGFMTNPDF